jgi:hypothetical protein
MFHVVVGFVSSFLRFFVPLVAAARRPSSFDVPPKQFPEFFKFFDFSYTHPNTSPSLPPPHKYDEKKYTPVFRQQIGNIGEVIWRNRINCNFALVVHQ